MPISSSGVASSLKHCLARQSHSCPDVIYADKLIGQHRLDVLVDGEIIVELKAVEKILKVHAAQLLSTLKAAKKQIGLVINFNQETLVRGLKRVVN